MILIVDDDQDIRDSLTDLFGSVGMRTTAYGSTNEMLGDTLPDGPTCLVLDLRLPGSSGLELQAQLASQGVDIPIIFITGHADVPTSVRAMKAGALDFLSKPFREQELLDAVTDALRRDGERRSAQRERDSVRQLAQELTTREIDVLKGVARGLLNKQIAYELGITEVTVKMHRSSAGKKLKSISVADMVRKIDLLGL
ncbi:MULTISPECIES: response regulator transcription factor [unclassified Novosphingobium]|uniref:response regulator transcription factor n=1 Tax=unclassified Novosphingobium TaxID=2644732 RepID=UPI00061C2D39|nr:MULTISPECIES: response regulator [unclassified Novosphingobium]RQW42478.1 DNA-binding response regulator [Novosphingobium sp. LASN5T]GAO56379.1 nitrogen regulation protein NR I [Novosphingobium sp. MD-1]